LQHVAGAIDIGRRSFLVQIGTVANAFFFAVFALFIALVAAGFMLVVVHQESLRHPWAEGFARLMSPRSAQFWSWVALALPFAVGLGIAVPTAAFLGMLWPSLRARERMLFVALVLALAAGPFLAPAMGRFSLPLRPQSAPLYDIATLHGESFDPARAERLSAAAALDPENGFLQFGLGWTARRGHDLSAAETAYGRALAAWPKSDVVLNNLGNVLFAQGRVDEAMARYREAIAANPDNAAAYFNLARIHTDRYDYRAASEALSKASSIDFDLVKSSQDHASKNGLPFMIDEWIPARAFWAATFSPATRAPDALPPSWWGRMETSGWPFTGAALALCLVALVFGVRAHATMPLRACHNCGRVVCRRCAQRRRELALCAVCAAVEARAESPEFARVLLGRERLGLQRRTRITRTTLAALIPCYGLLACRRVFRAVFLLAMIALAAAPYGGVRAPFVLNAAPEWPSGSPLDVGLWLPWVLIVALSLLGYLSASARVSSGASDPPTLVRSRPVATSRVTDMAA
jgi:tetratricopeptide (TPR) repeat protein